jgi:effector-binding domain-containing protein
MTPEIRDEPFAVVLYGSSRRHQAGICYGDDIRALLDQVWPVLRQHQIPSRGINHVVYSAGDDVFAGVEADVADAAAVGLERREVRLDRYAYAKHVGPYSGLPSACESLQKWLTSQGYRATAPLVEIYGHWNGDQSKLETELVQAFA